MNKKIKQKNTVKPCSVELAEVKKALKNERIRCTSYKKTKEDQAKNIESLIIERAEESNKANKALFDLMREKNKSIWTLIKEGRRWF